MLSAVEWESDAVNGRLNLAGIYETRKESQRARGLRAVLQNYKREKVQ